MALLAALVATGMATRYAPGVMDQVVANRQQWGQLLGETRPADCVALLSCEWLGHEVWLELPDGRIHGPLLVVDCAAAQDQERLEQLGFAVDLSYELAVKLGVLDAPLRGVMVWDANPRAGKQTAY